MAGSLLDKVPMAEPAPTGKARQTAGRDCAIL